MVRVKKNCDSWYYTSFDISPDGEKISAQLSEKWIDKAPDGWRGSGIRKWYYFTTHLVEFDLNGCNEELIIEGER